MHDDEKAFRIEHAILSDDVDELREGLYDAVIELEAHETPTLALYVARARRLLFEVGA